ncbi:phosphatase PAP2 family protein [Streptomyces sp. ISL-94]|uniref:phosphatase PAP2 family protein n=1 Tax=Streptomyces sp. ISL-94 TaxID=2819190 RepID=UPI001BE5DC0C|nr:phosphatase PAP2 family protein [Streptomyces sp. ISL-94]MBT2480632.1 phosphatase PAP2 family protein [Streptomyces sp. ISL-94]
MNHATTPPHRPDTPDRRPDQRPDGRSRGDEAPHGPGVLVLASALLFLGAAAVLALVVRSDVADPPFQRLDDRWLAWMGGPHGGPYAALAAVLNWFGGPLGVVVPLALLAVLLVRGRRASAAFLFLVYASGNLAVIQGLKHLVDRPRPANPLVRVDHGSFPSGHAATAALFVVLIGALLVPAARRRAWWPAGTVFTLAMMWSRTWLHAHWLSDTVAGAAAGAGTGLLAWWLCRAALAREAGKHVRVLDRRGAAAGVPERAAV